jgi:hypothetical protein
MTSHRASFPPPLAGEVDGACEARDRRRGCLDAAKPIMRDLPITISVHNNQISLFPQENVLDMFFMRFEKTRSRNFHHSFVDR